MVENYLRQSTLASLGLSALEAREVGGKTGVKMGEKPFHGQIGLRGDVADQTFLEATEKALGFALPLTPNTTTGKASKSAFWLGPDEWLITTAPDAAPKLLVSLTDKLTDQHVAVFDVSDSRTIIEISGINARDVLMKGCNIDFHPRHFGPGQCAQSTLALAHVLVHQTALNKRTGAPTYHVYVHRSFAEYLWAWLEDAAAEYGIGIISG